ncbi:DUF397 domain-containing protein [Frankia sp. CcI49]|uniref:DUF397 domain-containing protein n=1 Tax=Frankia sp. CcI49 TaxID=1745382 RepID=UPI0009758F09|nr:DUF397 domain-containing protein [Frankia sp. CcI49]ONH57851.1 DUF397 domain-containing protein [Frankia sp. CcI49]
MHDFDLSRTFSTIGCSGSNCVEVAILPDGGRAVRDSKNLDGPAQRFTATEWAAFLAGVPGREFE